MSTKTYSIYKAAKDLGGLSNHKLVIELHKNHFSCLVIDELNNIIAFEFFEFENAEFDIEVILSEVMVESRILDKSFSSTELYFNTAEAVLIPKNHNTKIEVDDFLNVACGTSYTIENKLDSPFSNSEIEVAYRISNDFIKHLNTRFIGVEYHHTYSKIIKELFHSHKKLEQYFVKIQVYRQHFIVVVVKEKKLQFIQSFDFKTTYDALYYLMNTCSQLEIPINEIQIELSGLVDLQSSLYLELMKYFRNISLQEVDTNTASDFNQYPPHYFAAFVNLAL